MFKIAYQRLYKKCINHFLLTHKVYHCVRLPKWILIDIYHCVKTLEACWNLHICRYRFFFFFFEKINNFENLMSIRTNTHLLVSPGVTPSLFFCRALLRASGNLPARERSNCGKVANNRFWSKLKFLFFRLVIIKK